MNRSHASQGEIIFYMLNIKWVQLLFFLLNDSGHILESAELQYQVHFIQAVKQSDLLHH